MHRQEVTAITRYYQQPKPQIFNIKQLYCLLTIPHIDHDRNYVSDEGYTKGDHHLLGGFAILQPSPYTNEISIDTIIMRESDSLPNIYPGNMPYGELRVYLNKDYNRDEYRSQKYVSYIVLRRSVHPNPYTWTENACMFPITNIDDDFIKYTPIHGKYGIINRIIQLYNRLYERYSYNLNGAFQLDPKLRQVSI